MPAEYIITMTAANRAGILSSVTNAMAELGADLRETSQTVVRGYFTMIFAAEFPDDIEPTIIREHLAGVCQPFGIEPTVSPRVEHSPTSPQTDVGLWLLRIEGGNRRGVLRKIAHQLSVDSIDISGFNATRTDDGAEFRMTARLSIPSSVSIESVKTSLESIGQDEGFALTLERRE